MDHNDNKLRVKIKVRNSNAAAATVGGDVGNKQFCSIGDMRFDSETTIEKGLFFQPQTPATVNRRSSPSFSSSPSAAFDFVDCSLSLPSRSWSVTGRRGRKSTSSTATVTLNTKRMKVETQNEIKSSKRKMHSQENSNKNEGLEKEYKCNICNKVFSSSRAVGGHKSSHYKANKTDTTITKETASATIGATVEPKIASLTDRTVRKRVMDFDLNQMPLNEEAILESCSLHL